MTYSTNFQLRTLLDCECYQSATRGDGDVLPAFELVADGIGVDRCARLEVLGVHRDGGMQEWLSVPVKLLHASPVLSLEQLALIETLGIGYHAVERGAPAKGEWVVVAGAGPIGLAVM